MTKKFFIQLAQTVEQLIQTERTMERQLDEMEEAAVAAESASLPQLTRIMLLHADTMRGMLEQSRNFWMKLSAALSVVLLICSCILLLLLFL